MTHLLRRLARLLTVAGGCSVAVWCYAGSPETTNIPAATQNVSPAQAGQEAMKVEVALLGDPATMRLALSVSIDGDSVAVKGHVPDESSRRRVLEVARQSCYLPVVDGLTVPSHSAIDAGALKKSARDSLVRQMGGKADRLTITASETGEIKLEGDVSSVEEKLLASRALRGVLGCTRVVNCLSLRTIEQAGYPVTVVSSDGQDVTCTPPTVVAKSSEQPLQRVQYYSDIYPPASRSRGTVPSGLPQNGKVVNITSGTPIQTTQPAPAAGCDCAQSGILSHDKPTVVEAKPTILEKMSAWKTSRASRKQPAPSLPSRVPGSQVMPGQPVEFARTAPPRQVEATPVSMPRQATPTTVEPPPAQELPRQSSDAGTWPPAHRNGPVTAAPAASLYQSRPLATIRISGRNQAAQQAYQTAGQSQPIPQVPAAQPQPQPLPQTVPNIVQASSSPEAKAPTAVPVSVEPLAHSPAGYVPAPTPELKPGPKAEPAPIRLTEKELHRRISEACGKLAKEVKIDVTAERGVVVHVYAFPATEHLLVAKLLHVPELAARNVQLHVHLAN